MTPRLSESESGRFGYRIGRLDIADDVGLADIAQCFNGFDVVIVRAPASLRSLPAALARLDDHYAIAADNLCYWEWRLDQAPAVDLPAGLMVSDKFELSDLMDVVRASFAGYGNHYAANPLFAPTDVLDGYCEWVEGLLSSGGSSCFVLHERGGALMGFALIDWTADIAEIRLAGMSPPAQGRGLYASLLNAVMTEAMDRDRVPIRISTQSDNINVMRSWARLGLLPKSTIATHHVVKRVLLGG